MFGTSHPGSYYFLLWLQSSHLSRHKRSARTRAQLRALSSAYAQRAAEGLHACLPLLASGLDDGKDQPRQPSHTGPPLQLQQRDSLLDAAVQPAPQLLHLSPLLAVSGALGHGGEGPPPPAQAGSSSRGGGGRRPDKLESPTGAQGVHGLSQAAGQHAGPTGGPGSAAGHA